MSKTNAVVFSGSFNPVHIGHLAIANYVVEFTSIDEFWFSISPQNPFKSSGDLAAFQHRFKMLEMSISELNLPFMVSDIENLLPRPSYTINTMEALSTKYPDRKWSLLIGSDNLANFDKWKDWQQIVENYQLLVYPRPGSDNDELYEKYNARKINAPLMEISSSFIRENLAKNRNLSAFLPNGVFEYIQKSGLYVQ